MGLIPYVTEMNARHRKAQEAKKAELEAQKAAEEKARQKASPKRHYHSRYR